MALHLVVSPALAARWEDSADHVTLETLLGSGATLKRGNARRDDMALADVMRTGRLPLPDTEDRLMGEALPLVIPDPGTKPDTLAAKRAKFLASAAKVSWVMALWFVARLATVSPAIEPLPGTEHTKAMAGHAKLMTSVALWLSSGKWVEADDASPHYPAVAQFVNAMVGAD